MNKRGRKHPKTPFVDNPISTSKGGEEYPIGFGWHTRDKNRIPLKENQCPNCKKEMNLIREIDGWIHEKCKCGLKRKRRKII